MNSKLKKAFKIISDVLVILVVAFAFLLHGSRIFGLKPYTVLSGSMESVYPTGSLIYVIGADPSELEVNDVITFQLQNGTTATHRIIELVPDEADPDTVRFRTKGDENEIADGTLVGFDDVIGTPVFCIPWLGYFATYISCPPGKYVATIVALGIVLLETIISIVLDDKTKRNSKVFR